MTALHIYWDNALNTGIDEIDKQHKKLVDYINELHVCITNGDIEGAQEIYKKLLEYTIEHFSFEEKMFNDYNYPLTEGHIGSHKQFVNMLTSYKERYDQNKDKKVLRELHGFLTNWLMSHIKKDDMAYVKDLLPKMQKKPISSWLKKNLPSFFRKG